MARRKPPSGGNASLYYMEPNAAGVDVGATEVFVAVAPDRDPQPIRNSPTFTVDLYRLADGLRECRIETVAMNPQAYIGFLASRFWNPEVSESV
jgi:hypothetical protein